MSGTSVSREVIGELKKKADAALTNEQPTRLRVQNIETWVKAFEARALRDRLKWLLLGK